VVLEAGLDKFFDSPAMWESLEVVMALSSLGDPSKNERDKQIRTYHCNNFAMTSFGWQCHIMEQSTPATAVNSQTQHYQSSERLCGQKTNSCEGQFTG
jgi:hypothetical protein